MAAKRKDNDRWRYPDNDKPRRGLLIEAWVSVRPGDVPVFRDNARYLGGGRWGLGNDEQEVAECHAWRPVRRAACPAWVMKVWQERFKRQHGISDQ